MLNLVLGNDLKRELLKAPASFLPLADGNRPCDCPRAGRTRALVRIQEGCDNRCTYCIVWQLRGPQVSRPAAKVLEEVRRLVADGHQEVVLTGVHIGAYGKRANGHVEAGEADLWTLVRELLARTEVRRLRLSSIEPWDLGAADFGLWRDERLCPHLHVPLQSGCDSVLARMGRRYTTEEYRRLLGTARAAVPDVAITTDIIVGFPGETEDEFCASQEFVRQCGFARIHVFPYSPRPGTLAATMPDQVPPAVRRERARQMREVAVASRRAYEDAFVGRTVPVLWEARQGKRWSGHTPNYLKVFAPGEGDLQNEVTPCLVLGRDRDALVGRVLSPPGW